MKNITLGFILLFGLNTNVQSEDICAIEGLEDLESIELKSIKLTKKRFYTMDVFVNLNFESCAQSIKQAEYQDKDGNEYRAFSSTEDDCDGGNVYGVVYSADMKTVKAHIYDGDIYCGTDIEEFSQVKNNTCRLTAINMVRKAYTLTNILPKTSTLEGDLTALSKNNTVQTYSVDINSENDYKNDSRYTVVTDSKNSCDVIELKKVK